LERQASEPADTAVEAGRALRGGNVRDASQGCLAVLERRRLTGVAGDGRFLVIEPIAQQQPEPVTVLMNRPAVLDR
jgi:hypothetical protein